MSWTQKAWVSTRNPGVGYSSVSMANNQDLVKGDVIIITANGTVPNQYPAANNLTLVISDNSGDGIPWILVKSANVSVDNGSNDWGAISYWYKQIGDTGWASGSKTITVTGTGPANLTGYYAMNQGLYSTGGRTVSLYKNLILSNGWTNGSGPAISLPAETVTGDILFADYMWANAYPTDGYNLPDWSAVANWTNPVPGAQSSANGVILKVWEWARIITGANGLVVDLVRQPSNTPYFSYYWIVVALALDAPLNKPSNSWFNYLQSQSVF